MTVTAVVGAQFGSEGKGTIVNALADEYEVHVRVGAPNAGHSFWHNEPEPWAMQSVPCGWTNPDALLVIGRGAVVHLGILKKEIDAIEAAGYSVRDRLMIDTHAFVLEERHHQAEGGVDGEIHKRIGSTGEGVGACRVDRLNRRAGEGMLMWDVDHAWVKNLLFDTVEELHKAHSDGSSILFEGAQGFGLSLIHGFWPHVTSNDTNAGQMLVDAGLPPSFIDEVIVVARTYPIRVAGPSGPMKDVLTWEQMSDKIGREVCEQTTVTKKTRRIAEWDERLFLRACKINGPTQIAVTFTDYLDPSQEGKPELTERTRAFIHYLESVTGGVPVKFVGVGGPRWLVVRR
jgi:adenylosuccinate synthase